VRKIGLIIKREYLTRVKTKGFVITTLIVPLIGLGTILLIAFLISHTNPTGMRITVVDNSGTLAQPIEHGLDGKLSNGRPQFDIVATITNPSSPDALQQDLRTQINTGKLDVYLWIPQDSTQPFELHMRNPNSFSLLEPLRTAINQAVIGQRLSAHDIRVDDIKAILKDADIKTLKVNEQGESVEKGQSFVVAIVLVVLLYTALLSYGIITMRSVIEEKTTRTMEVLISSVRPFELLAGKILGVAAVAFTQFGIWLAFNAILFSYGVLASWGMTRNSDLAGVHVPISLLAYAGLFFFGGYFLYSSMFAAIGSACSSEQDSQQLQWLAMAPLVFCMLIYGVILNDPTSTAAIVLSEIPFFAPVLMSLRISLQTPPAWQIALSLSLLFLTVATMVWLSSKIYRVGVLMYGKRPSVVELLRWLRYT
jgi:ABC-2 type transport system permease protein